MTDKKARALIKKARAFIESEPYEPEDRLRVRAEAAQVPGDPFGAGAALGRAVLAGELVQRRARGRPKGIEDDSRTWLAWQMLIIEHGLDPGEAYKLVTKARGWTSRSGVRDAVRRHAERMADERKPVPGKSITEFLRLILFRRLLHLLRKRFDVSP